MIYNRKWIINEMVHDYFHLRCWFVIMVPEEIILEWKMMFTNRAHLGLNVQRDLQKHPKDCANITGFKKHPFASYYHVRIKKLSKIGFTLFDRRYEEDSQNLLTCCSRVFIHSIILENCCQIALSFSFQTSKNDLK